MTIRNGIVAAVNMHGDAFDSAIHILKVVGWLALLIAGGIAAIVLLVAVPTGIMASLALVLDGIGAFGRRLFAFGGWKRASGDVVPQAWEAFADPARFSTFSIDAATEDQGKVTTAIDFGTCPRCRSQYVADTQHSRFCWDAKLHGPVPGHMDPSKSRHVLCRKCWHELVLLSA